MASAEVTNERDVVSISKVGNTDVLKIKEGRGLQISVDDGAEHAVSTDVHKIMNDFKEWLSSNIFQKIRPNMRIPELGDLLMETMEKMVKLDEHRDAEGKVFSETTVCDIRRMVIGYYKEAGGEVGQPVTEARLEAFLEAAGPIGKLEAEINRHLQYYSDETYPTTVIRLGQSPELEVDDFARDIDAGFFGLDGIKNNLKISAMGKDPQSLHYGNIALVLPTRTSLLFKDGKKMHRADRAAAVKKWHDYYGQIKLVRNKTTARGVVLPELGFCETPDFCLSDIEKLLVQNRATESGKTPLQFHPVWMLADIIEQGVQIAHINLTNLTNKAPPPSLCCGNIDPHEVCEQLQSVTLRILNAVLRSKETLSHLRKLSLPSSTRYGVIDVNDDILIALSQIIQEADIEEISLAGCGLVSCGESFENCCNMGWSFYHRLNVSESVFTRFASSLAECTTLKAVNLSYNSLGDEYGTVLLRALTDVTRAGAKLRKVDLSGNYLGEDAAEHIKNLIDETSLVSLDISNNELIQGSMAIIISAMGYRRSLQAFKWHGNQRTTVSNRELCGLWFLPIPCLYHTSKAVLDEEYNEAALERLQCNASLNDVFRIIVNVGLHQKHIFTVHAHLMKKVTAFLDQEEQRKLNEEKEEKEKEEAQGLQQPPVVQCTVSPVINMVLPGAVEGPPADPQQPKKSEPCVGVPCVEVEGGGYACDNPLTPPSFDKDNKENQD